MSDDVQKLEEATKESQDRVTSALESFTQVLREYTETANKLEEASPGNPVSQSEVFESMVKDRVDDALKK